MAPRAATALLFLSGAVLVPGVPGGELHAAKAPMPFAVSEGPGARYDPQISGRVVVWAQAPRGDRVAFIPRYRIYAQTVSIRRGPQVVSESAVIDAMNQVSVSGHTVIWTDCRFCHRVAGMPGYAGTQIWGEDLLTRKTFPVSSSQGNASSAQIDGKRVVWLQYGSRGSTSIVVRDLASRRDMVVAQGHRMKSMPDIFGTTVVWNERRGQG